MKRILHMMRPCRGGGAFAGAVLLFLAATVAAGPEPARAADAVSRALDTGRIALEDEVYTVAEKQFRYCLQKAPKGSPQAEEANLLLARALHGQKKYAEALQLLRGTDTASAYWRASALFELQKYDECLKELAGFRDRHGEDGYTVRALRLLARCHLKRGEAADALGIFGHINEKYGETRDGTANLLDWAQTLVGLERREEALGVLKDLTDRHPDSDEGQRGRQLTGWILVQEKKYDQASGVFSALATQVTAQAEYRTEAALMLAGAAEAGNMQDAATNALRYAMEIAPGPDLKRKASVALGMILLRMKKPAEGAACLKPFIAAIPQDPDAGTFQLAVADAFMECGSNEQASVEYQYYLETFSDPGGKARALAGKGWALWLLPSPRYDEAAAAFLQASEQSKDPGEIARCLIKAADSQFRAGKYDAAAVVYRSVMERFPSSPLAAQAAFQAAESMARAGKATEAEDAFRALASTNTDEVFADQAALRVAEMQEDRGDMNAALGTYEKFMAGRTNSAMRVNALLGHGLVNYRSLRFEAALADFDRLVTNAPQSELAEHAWYMRARCLQITGRKDRAMETCREFVKLFPASRLTPKVVFWLGECLYNDSDYKAAEEQFAFVSRGFTNDSLYCNALLRAGESAVRQKEYLRAIEYFAQLAKDRPESPLVSNARYAQGDARVELGEFSGAILIFEEIINKHPESYFADMAMARKGDCEFALGRDDSERFKSAMNSYKIVAESQSSPSGLKLQAQYKIGNCLRKLELDDQAFEQYYKGVVLSYMEDKTGLVRKDPACDLWFARAAFDAADILEGRKQYGQAIKLLRRIAEANVAASGEARQRIDKTRRKYWDLLLLE